MASEKIDINKIKLNPKNPRIAGWESFSFEDDALSHDDALEAIKNLRRGDDRESLVDLNNPKDSFRALQKSILAIGENTRPIIVHKLKDKDGEKEYIVIEGNTRLSIYLEFAKKFPDEKKWKKINCELEKESPEHYHLTQLTSHVVGPKSWDPFCRAKYLSYLKNKGKIDFDRYKEICGGGVRAKLIEQEIRAFEHMEKWRESSEFGADYNTSKFSYFLSFQIKKKELEGVNYTEDDFIKHINKDLFSKAADIRELKNIWKNPEIDPNGKCKRIFLDEDGGGSEEAIIEFKNLKRQRNIIEEDDLLRLSDKLQTEISKYMSEKNYQLRKEFVEQNKSIEQLEGLQDSLKSLILELIDIKKES